MALGDVYKLIDKQAVGGEEAVNIYWYRHDAGTGSAANLSEAFVDDMLPSILEVQTSNVVHTSLEIINMDDPTDFLETPLIADNVGTAVGTVMPTFVAWSFQLIRSSRTVRNGRKSICGVSEEDTTGSVADADALVRLNVLAGAMGSPIVDAGTNTFQPVIYGLPTPPPSNLPLRVVDVDSAVYRHVSTQNSRKIF